MNIFVLIHYADGTKHTFPIQSELTWDELYNKLSTRLDSVKHILSALNIQYEFFDFELYELDAWLRNCYIVE